MCFAVILALFIPALYANDVSDEGDCPIVIPNFDNTMLLTKEERIQLMDQALKDALAEVQDCEQRFSNVQKRSNSNASNSNISDNASTGTNNNVEQADNTESKQSDIQDQQTATPSSELSGTEPLQTQQTNGEDTISGSPQDYSSIPLITKDNKKTLSNGKLPEDIPSADNDDIIAKQIREAALAESDPQKQAKLWNEYRRYRGISEK